MQFKERIWYKKWIGVVDGVRSFYCAPYTTKCNVLFGLRLSVCGYVCVCVCGFAYQTYFKQRRNHNVWILFSLNDVDDMNI